MVPDAGPPPRHLARFVRGLPAAEDALDLGCGDGRLTKELTAGPGHRAPTSPSSRSRAPAAGCPTSSSSSSSRTSRCPSSTAPSTWWCAWRRSSTCATSQLFLSEARRVLRPDGTLASPRRSTGACTAARALWKGFEEVFDPLSPHIRFFTAAVAEPAARRPRLRRPSAQARGGHAAGLSAGSWRPGRSVAPPATNLASGHGRRHPRHPRHPRLLQRLRDGRRADHRPPDRPRARGDRLLPPARGRARASRSGRARAWCTCRRCATSTWTPSSTRCCPACTPAAGASPTWRCSSSPATARCA